MNKIVLWVVLGVVLVGGVVYIGLSGRGVQDMASEVGKNMNERPAGKKMAFSEFMKQGGAYTCTFNQNIDNAQATGKLFIDKGSVRGTFDTITNGIQVQSNFLVHNGFSYFWSSASSVGIKTALTAEQQSETTGMYDAWNPEQVADYDCTPWNRDEAVFTAPSGVQFMDIAQAGGMYTR